MVLGPPGVEPAVFGGIDLDQAYLTLLNVALGGGGSMAEVWATSVTGPLEPVDDDRTHLENERLS